MTFFVQITKLILKSTWKDKLKTGQWNTEEEQQSCKMYTVKVTNTLWYCLKDQKTDKPEQNRVRKDLGMKNL